MSQYLSLPLSMAIRAVYSRRSWLPSAARITMGSSCIFSRSPKMAAALL